MTLRPYQAAAVSAVYRHLRERDDNPCVVIPTGGGKTQVIATICRDVVQLWRGRAIVIEHTKELLAQVVDKLHTMSPELREQIGIYSAGMSSRDTEHPIIVGGIQSIYQRADEIGHRDIAIVDEAHLIPPDGEGMYRRLLSDLRRINPRLRVIGLTATPFRMTSGPICAPPPDGILNSICYEIGVRELIADGYLSKLKAKAGSNKPDFDSLHIRAGEYIASEVEAMMDRDLLVHSACREIVDQVGKTSRKSCLIFAASIKHGQHVAKTIEQISGEECGFVDGDLPNLFRDQIIRRFRDGDLRYIANVNLLTIGFDAPNVDCVAILRPTMSAGLYYQMVGRGFRLAPGKTDCLVLDYGGNVLRHGPVDQLRVADKSSKGSRAAPAKECPQCRALIATGYAACPDCGYDFPAPERRTHAATASSTGLLSGEVTITKHRVYDVAYRVHVKRDAPKYAPRTMRVDYEIGFRETKSEWVCLEHNGYARRKAEQWWRARSMLPAPNNVDDAVALANAGALAGVSSITVRSVAGEKYDRIIDYELGDIPDPADLSLPETSDLPDYVPAHDDIPF